MAKVTQEPPADHQYGGDREDYQHIVPYLGQDVGLDQENCILAKVNSRPDKTKAA